MNEILANQGLVEAFNPNVQEKELDEKTQAFRIEKAKLLAEIMYLATVANFETNRCLFLDMSGHVDTLRISVRQDKEMYQNELATSEISLKPMKLIEDDPKLLEEWNAEFIKKLINTRDTLKSFIKAENVDERFLLECDTAKKKVFYTF